MAFISLTLITPAFIALMSFFIRRQVYNLKRASFQMLITVTIATVGAMTQMHRYFNDTEVVSGVVTGTTKDKVPCTHKKEHEFDYNWAVHFSTGEHVLIDRVDKQGKIMPDRWALANIGEAASFLRKYKNHVKGMPEEIFKYNDTDAVDKYRAYLPSYPRLIYDYYRVNRLVTVNFPVLPKEIKAYSSAHHTQVIIRDRIRRGLTALNSRIGTEKEANVIIVLVHMLRDDFASAIRSHWRGAKKNDIVVIIGVDTEYNIRWASAMAPAENESFPYVLADAILKKVKIPKNIDPKKDKGPEPLLRVIETQVKTDFKRRHFDDLDYVLMTTIPSKNFFGLVFVFAMFVNLFMSGRYYLRSQMAWRS